MVSVVLVYNLVFFYRFLLLLFLFLRLLALVFGLHPLVCFVAFRAVTDFVRLVAIEFWVSHFQERFVFILVLICLFLDILFLLRIP